MIDTQACIIESPQPTVDFDKWQRVVNIMAKLYNSASGTIVQYRAKEFNVVATSQNDDNFLSVNTKWPWDIQSFCRRIMETRSELYVNDAGNSIEWQGTDPVVNGPVRSYFGLPIFWPNQQLFGSICVIDTTATNYSKLLKELLWQFKHIIESDLKHLVDLEHIKNLAITDDLTQLYNRRGLLTLAKQRLKDGKRFKQKVAVIYLDIDNLKQTNDNFGHKAGDQLLMSLVNILQKNSREADIIARLGGDEFLIMLLLTDEQYVDQLKNEIEQEFSDLCATISANQTAGVSMGHIIADCQKDISIEVMIEKADQRMYQNKQTKKHS